MSSPGKRGALAKATDWLNARAPRKGFFSTLDSLIENAPFEKGSADQWLSYLKPGRMLEREGIRFPLKKEEIDWTDLPGIVQRQALVNDTLSRTDPALGIMPGLSRDELLTVLRRDRPAFKQQIRAPDRVLARYDAARARGLDVPDRVEYEDAFHEGTLLDKAHDPVGGEDYRNVTGLTGDDFGGELYQRYMLGPSLDTYRENVTRMPEYINFSSHYEPDALSWSLSDRRRVGPGDEESGMVRKVKEIQSDLHQAGRERGYRPLDLSSQERSINKRLAELGAPYGYDAMGMRRLASNLSPQGFPQDSLGRNLADIMGEDFAEAATLDRRLEELYSAVPDAPFKDVKDYGSLELKKLMLEAADDGDDYLAIAHPDELVAKYGDKVRRGMEYVYGRAYPSALEQLAKRYEAPFERLSASADVPEVRTESKLQSFADVLGLDDENEIPNDIPDYMSEVDDIFRDSMSDVADSAELSSLLAWQADSVVLPAREIVRKVEAMPNADPHDIRMVRSYLAEIENKAKEQIEYIEGELAGGGDEAVVNMVQHMPWLPLETKERRESVELLGEMMNRYRNARSGEPVLAPRREVPAMRLTPEVRERIKRVGVPLWATGAGAVGLEAMGVQDEPPVE